MPNTNENNTAPAPELEPEVRVALQKNLVKRIIVELNGTEQLHLGDKMLVIVNIIDSMRLSLKKKHGDKIARDFLMETITMILAAAAQED